MKNIRIFIILIFCFAFSGCFFIPCNTTLIIENEGISSKIILISYDKNAIECNIQNGEKQHFKNRLMKNIEYLYIKNDIIEGILEIRDTDHWFPQSHKINILIKNEYFEKNGETDNIFSAVSYKTYYNRDNEVVDFETLKEKNYKEIYDIIKKEK